MAQPLLSSSSPSRRWLRSARRNARGLLAVLRGALLFALLVFLMSGTEQAQARSAPGEDKTAQDSAEIPSRGTTDVSPEVAQKAAAIARQTMSPFCPGRTLSDCPSEYATAWRRDIRAMVARGMSADEIQRELESRVGANLSGSPNRAASYSVSLGLALGAALVLFFVLSRLRHNSRIRQSGASQDSSNKRQPGAPTATANSSPDAAAEKDVPAVDDQRLERELLALSDDDD